MCDIEDIARETLPVTSFPFKAPKKPLREVNLAVCVLKCLQSDRDVAVSGLQHRSHFIIFSSEYLNIFFVTSASLYSNVSYFVFLGCCSYYNVRYLCVRRPNKGLLANQWELPSVELPQNISEQDIATACFSLLRDIFGILIETSEDIVCSVDIKQSVAKVASCAELFCLHAAAIKLHQDPVVHIFSHERHTSRVIEIDVDPLFSASLRTDVELFGMYESIGETVPRQVLSVCDVHRFIIIIY